MMVSKARCRQHPQDRDLNIRPTAVSSCSGKSQYRAESVQVLLDTHSGTAAFNLSHAEEISAQESAHTVQRYTAFKTLPA